VDSKRLTASFSELLERCKGKRDIECLCRLFKELCILEEDFEMAAQFRDFQCKNLPNKTNREERK
jgi:hypothetical protein